MTRRGVWERLPSAIMEAALIVFAVLVALGVDEYWETLEERALAETAVERIAAEVASNRADLLNSRESNVRLAEDLERAISSLDAGDGPGIDGVNYEVSLLGTDAWQTAQVTRAVHFMDFDQVGRISQVYRVQQLYVERQAPIVDAVSTLGVGDIGMSFRAIRRGLAVTLALECNLVAEYDSLLTDLAFSGASGGSTASGCE